MGKLHLITGYWEAKVGELVGAKWKSVKTVRAYAVPSNPNTESQQTVRSVFKEMSQFISIFADGIKYLTALDTKSMTLRNAIMHINKDQFSSGTFSATDLLISKGGLPAPINISSATVTSSSYKPVVVVTISAATNITSEAKLITVFVDTQNEVYDVVETPISADDISYTVTSNVTFQANTTANSVYCYTYILDKHGSYKVASKSTVYVFPTEDNEENAGE